MFKATLSPTDSNDDWPPVDLVLERFEADLARTGTHRTSMAGAGPPPEPKSSPRIGHNPSNVAPPRPIPGTGHNRNGALRPEEAKLARELADRIEAIVDSAYTGSQKLVLIKILLRCDYKTLKGAFPSYTTLMRAASVKDSRAIKAALGVLIAEDDEGSQLGIVFRKFRNGKSPTYGLSREHLQALVAEWVIRNRAKSGPPPTTEPPASNVPPTSNDGGRPTSSIVPPTLAPPQWMYPYLLSLLKANSKESDAGAIRPATPHLTAEGFIISADHGLMVPMQKVQEWRDRFPHIPDLDAAMTGLGTTILSRGRMHPGWTCPEGWMVKPLSAMNQEAADRKKVTAAIVARASNGSASPRGKNRRAELDNI